MGVKILPAGSGTELQYRAGATRFGAVTGTSWNGTALTLPKFVTIVSNFGGSLTISRESATDNVSIAFTDAVGGSVGSIINVGTANANIAGTAQDDLGIRVDNHKLVISTNAGGTPHITVDSVGVTTWLRAGGDTTAPSIVMRKSRGTGSSPSAISTGDELGVINFQGYSGAGGYVTGAAIKAISEGTVATTRVPAHISFWTGTDAAPTVLTERMRVSNDGVRVNVDLLMGDDATGGHDPGGFGKVIWLNDAANGSVVYLADGDNIGQFGYFGTELRFWNRANGPVYFGTNGADRWQISATGIFQAEAAQTIQTATGQLTLATAAGNGDIALTPHGTGNVKFGSHSALAGETVTGYITIKDAAGNARKLAVVS